MKLAIKMIVTLSIIGAVTAGILNSVWNWADPLIKENERKATEEAIGIVQPNKVKYERLDIKEFEIYKVTDAENADLGYALVTVGNGFQNKIKLMVGLNKELTEIVGLTVLDQQETPGLGDEISKPYFQDRFKNLNITQEITYLKGVKGDKNKGQIQAITGATISSKAVVKLLNVTLQQLRKLKEFGGSNEK